MTTVRVNSYTLRRLTRAEEWLYSARWRTSFRGERRFFRTRKEAVDAISKWPPRGMESIKA